MAIDKNSKAYQWLLADGYSDQQIMDMYNRASSWENRQEVVASTKPVNTPTTQPTQQPTQPTPEVKEETVVKQEETPVSTVPEIKQEWELKPLSQDYYNQTSDDAQSKIISNLNNYRQTNPEYFRDYESFKKNFSYDARNDEQRQTLDSWYGGYQKWMELAWIPVTDLYTQYKDGQVSMNELENLRVYDPTKYAELQNQINKWNIIAAYDDDKWVDTTWMSLQDMAYQYTAQLFQRFMNWDSSSAVSQYFDNYKNNVNSPEMLEIQDKTTDLQEQIENLNDDRARIKKEVEKEYEWTWATRSKINAIIADRSYELDLQLRTLNSEYNKYATQYNNRMNQYQNEFKMQLQEYQLNQDARTQQMKELWFAMDLMNFETNEQKAQREWDYWVKQQEYTNWNINSKDYDTRYKAALKSVQNLLSQYEGIPMQRSAEQMAQDILTAIDNWSNIWAELTKINKQIQSKPEYKKLYNNTFGASQWFGQTISIWWTDYVEYDWKLYTAEDFNKKFGGSKANYTVVSEDVISKASNWEWTYWSFMARPNNVDDTYRGQCGKYANDYLEEIWAGRPFGKEDIKTRESWINSDEWKVGTIAVFDYNHYSEDWINHWHVGIVVSAPDKNGNFWVKDSNFGSDGKIQTRMVNMKDVSLKWFIDPSRDQNGNKNVGANATLTDGNSDWTTVWGMSKAYEPTRVWLYDKYLNEWIAPTDAKLKAIWGWDLDKWWQIFDAEVADYMEKTWAWSLDKKKNDEVNKLRTEMHQNQAFTDYNQMQSYFQKIKDNTNNKTATAASDVALLFNFMKMLDPKSIVRESEFKTAQNMGSLPESWHASLKSAVNWEKLTDKQRTQIYEEAAGLMDWATYLYNNLLDDYSSMISYWGDASKLGRKWTYYTDEYINMYWNTNNSEEVYNLTVWMPLTWWATWWWEVSITWWYNIANDWNNFS